MKTFKFIYRSFVVKIEAETYKEAYEEFWRQVKGEEG